MCGNSFSMQPSTLREKGSYSYIPIKYLCAKAKLGLNKDARFGCLRRKIAGVVIIAVGSAILFTLPI